MIEVVCRLQRDAVIARKLLVGLFAGVCKELSGRPLQTFEKDLSQCVNFVLSKSEQYDPSMIATLLELALDFKLVLDSAVTTSGKLSWTRQSLQVYRWSFIQTVSVVFQPPKTASSCLWAPWSWRTC